MRNLAPANNFTGLKTFDNTCLSLGLKFIPTPKPLEADELKQSVTRLRRILLINEHVFKETAGTPCPRYLRTPSTWTPPLITDQQLEITALLDPVISSIATTSIYDRTATQAYRNDRIHKELKLLKDNHSIKITSADKNLGCTLLTTLAYDDYMIQSLSDPKIYSTIELATEDNPLEYTEFIVKQRYHLQIEPFITKHERKYIEYDSQNHTYLGTYYGMPKIHKGMPMNMLPFRPIIAGNPTQLQARVSCVLSNKLKPILNDYSSILKNSLDLKNRLDQLKMPASTLKLFSLDFVSLYTSIPLTDLYKLIQDSTNPSLTSNLKAEILRMLKFIFTNNFFLYGNDLKKQLDGIAMGTNSAPEIANLYLALKFDYAVLLLTEAELYGRYIDDCGIAFTGDTDHFITHSVPILEKAAHPLTFTWTVSDISMDLLDITIFKKDDLLMTKIYQKPLNKYSYIPPFSSHPEATLKGFITGEIIRYHRLSSLPADRDEIINLFHQRLKARGYQEDFLNPVFYKAIGKILRPPRMILSNPIPTQTLVIRYTNQPQVIANLKEQLKPLEQATGTRIRIVYSSNPTIRSLSSRSALTPGQLNLINESRTTPTPPPDVFGSL
jgi:hypothetical protein